MPNLTADSANPKVTFVDSGGPTDWWRLYGQSATDLKLQRWTGVIWGTNFEWTSSGNTSSQNLDISRGNPALSWTHSSGSAYSADSDGTRLSINEGATALMTLNSTENISLENFKIDKNTPTLTFKHPAVTDYTLDSDGTFHLKRGGTTIAQADSSNYLYANSGLVAGSTNAANAIRWARFSGALGAAGPATATINVTLGTAKRIIGAIVVLTTGTSDQNDNQYQLYDFLSLAGAGNKDFYVLINRYAANDQVVITYGNAYGATALYKILAFYEP